MAAESTVRRVETDKGTDLQSDIVRVLVGSGESLFQVHADVLRSNSEFFVAALNGEWIEGKTRVVNLPEEDEGCFRRYVQFVYSGAIACKGTSIVTEYNTLASMYVLGEHLLDTRFQDAVLRAFIATTQDDQTSRYPESKSKVVPGQETIDIIYTKTSEDSAARRLLVDIYVNCATSTFKFQQPGTKTHKSFLLEMVSAFAARRQVTVQERTEHAKRMNGSTCAYHHHKAGEPCNAK